jgi:polar amino acid transport system substrate-binding protein
VKLHPLPTAALGALMASSLILAGCSSSDDTSATPDASASLPTVEKVDSIAALVPASISEDGTLSFGTDASYAPSEFIDEDGKTIVGFDVDLGKAVATVMGLEGTFENSPFDALIPGVADSGKFEASMSSFTINAERLKQVNMVSYFNAGTAWATAKGNPSGISQDDACGKKVAVQRATVQADDIQARSKACVDAGKEAIKIDQYQLQSDATNAVVTGKDDAMLADSPVIAYAIQQTGDKLEQLGDIYDAAPYGAVVAKDQAQLAEAFQKAFQTLIDNGQYKQILEVWNVQNGAITKSEVNPAP